MNRNCFGQEMISEKCHSLSNCSQSQPCFFKAFLQPILSKTFCWQNFESSFFPVGFGVQPWIVIFRNAKISRLNYLKAKGMCLLWLNLLLVLRTVQINIYKIHHFLVFYFLHEVLVMVRHQYLDVFSLHCGQRYVFI